ncbi:glycosyltransferase family 2 protein [Hwangdonia lutea]|uniref:Glycosyltransferase family A protein n=1 Tax=Hwangdonia lutea TaxID=3075823 RepID=A0AA97EM84_9FLAO|nr:glycosyltransferase family A protein [Hwangdonia sp. SCSIO 19198]WOD43979.1 glycosyltransferase family A protein [Hwangdonia sp. SCSIO 19198]
MSNYLISVIVPCYNQAKYLDEALQSVLNQSFTDWECIIVNDGSTDTTEVVSNEWIKKDSRFKYIFQDNRGLSSARNLGVKKAESEFILPLDADDKIGENYLELAYQAFQENKEIKVVYCEAKKFGDSVELWKLPEFSLDNLSRTNVIFCSALFRKIDWETVGGFDVNMIHGWEDWEFWISLLKNGGLVKKIESVQFYYRVKEVSMLKAMDAQKTKETEEYLSVKHTDFFVKQLGSFNALLRETERVKKNYDEKLKSEKFVINMFLKKFFGFTIFKSNK